MKISIEQMQIIKEAPNSVYEPIKCLFLYHSNKLEGSTFTEEQLERLVEENKVSGNHDLEDVLQTRNSLLVLDFLVDSLGTALDKELLCELNKRLFASTDFEEKGYTGHYKYLANRIAGSHIELTPPNEVDQRMETLLQDWEASDKGFEAIADFHVKFEHIHPFQDGNGRIGRFIMLKQCIENNIDIITIDEERGKPYRAWLEAAQTTGNSAPFYEELQINQKLFDELFRVRGFDKLLPTPEQIAQMHQTQAAKSC